MFRPVGPYMWPDSSEGKKNSSQVKKARAPKYSLPQHYIYTHTANGGRKRPNVSVHQWGNSYINCDTATLWNT